MTTIPHIPNERARIAELMKQQGFECAVPNCGSMLDYESARLDGDRVVCGGCWENVSPGRVQSAPDNEDEEV
jgi:hypothetical protein